MQNKIDAVQHMQDYIAIHFRETITLADLAKVSFFSPWYSHRLFVKYTGITPAQYVRKLRLAKVALQLRDTPSKVLDVALSMGFESVDGFQRAFYREFGCNPGKYALHPIPINLFTPYSIKFRYVERRPIMENLRNIFIQIVEKPARKVILKRGSSATDYFAYCDEVGCDVWGFLKSFKSISGEPVCLWLPPSYKKPNTSEYVQGVEVPLTYEDVIPDGFDIIELPPATYLMFQGEPFEEEDYCQAIDEVKTAITKYSPSIIGYQWDHKTPRIQLEPIGTRGYIEFMPIQKV